MPHRHADSRNVCVSMHVHSTQRKHLRRNYVTTFTKATKQTCNKATTCTLFGSRLCGATAAVHINTCKSLLQAAKCITSSAKSTQEQLESNETMHVQHQISEIRVFGEIFKSSDSWTTSVIFIMANGPQFPNREAS